MNIAEHHKMGNNLSTTKARAANALAFFCAGVLLLRQVFPSPGIIKDNYGMD